MKEFQQKEDAKELRYMYKPYIQLGGHKFKCKTKGDLYRFTRLDLFPINPTRENVFKYICESGWVPGLVIKAKGETFEHLDDFIQELYLIIYDKIDKLIEVYENNGIAAFCAYLKRMVLWSVFKNGLCDRRLLKHEKFEQSFDISVMNDIYDKFNEDVYHFNLSNNILNYNNE